MQSKQIITITAENVLEEIILIYCSMVEKYTALALIPEMKD
jgi:hypothetical protein